MKIEIKVPSAGESVSRATVAQIMKPSGSFVKANDELLELETDKVNQVVYSPGEGVVELTVNVDDTVTIGQVIGTIDTEAKGGAPTTPKPAKEEAPKAKEPPSTEGEPARKMPSDFVSEMKRPVEPAAKPHQPTASPPKTKALEGVSSRRRMSGLRKTIAQKLVQVKNQTAMLTTFNELDMSNIMQIRAREQENFMKLHGVKLGFMSFFVKAVSLALKEFPDINSYIEGDEIVTYQTYDINIAVSTEKGLMVPVLRHADEKSFGQIEQEIASFARKSREGTISIDDMQGGGFTITNGGVFGSMLSTPILNPPQSGILGMHTIVKRPVVVGNEIKIRPIMYLALSYDHRIVDGREAIQFLVHIKGNLEEPTRMLIDL